MASGLMFDDVVQRVSAMQGVEAVAVSTRAPLDSSTPFVRVNAREAVPVAADTASSTASFLLVSARYFDVVKTPLVAGRAFTERDVAGQPPVAIVNETLAARLWPGVDAIGRRLWLEPHVAAAPCTVVGVARDSKYVTLGEGRQNHVYLPLAAPATKRGASGPVGWRGDCARSARQHGAGRAESGRSESPWVLHAHLDRARQRIDAACAPCGWTRGGGRCAGTRPCDRGAVRPRLVSRCRAHARDRTAHGAGSGRS